MREWVALGRDFRHCWYTGWKGSLGSYSIPSVRVFRMVYCSVLVFYSLLNCVSISIQGLGVVGIGWLVVRIWVGLGERFLGTFLVLNNNRLTLLVC